MPSCALRKLTSSLYVDSQPTRRDLGWTPPFSMEEGIRRTLASPLANPWPVALPSQTWDFSSDQSPCRLFLSPPRLIKTDERISAPHMDFLQKVRFCIITCAADSPHWSHW